MKNEKDWLLTVANKGQGTKLFEIVFSASKPGTLIQLSLLIILLILSSNSFSQNSDSIKVISNFGGAVTVTNNGISFIPTFSLNEPAAIFDLSMGRKLTFEPQLRFSLEGKPWSFLFWWRYKMLKTDKFSFTLGCHPALSFKTITVTINEVPQEMIRVQRYLAGELVPNYFITKNTSIGIYYLYSRCLEKESVRNTNFVTFDANFSNIRLPDQFYMKFIPQVYYLKMDKDDGFYFTSALTLANKKTPFSVQTVINKIIKTDIAASKNFVWNISLIYTFKNKYVKI